jgi:membrane fusion protein (multidrug efflux system)
MKFKRLHLIGAGIVIHAVFSCHSGTSETKSVKQKINSLTVEAIIVHPVVLDQSITVSGTLKPFEETVLMPEVPGRVVSINLPEGKTVKKGTVLIELFNDDLMAQLQKSQAQLQIAEETFKRQNELKKIEGISQSEYDQAQLQVNSIKADIEVLNVQIGRTKIRAPFDGTVGLRNVSVGAQVSQSTALVTIREVDQLKLDFSVPEKYSSEIKQGTTVKFMVQGDDKKYDATVMATEQGIEPSTRNLKARAIVKSQSLPLVPGAFANVEIRLGENRQALLVPTQAIIPQEKDKKLIVAKEGKANFVTVKTGTRTSSRIEILSGINAGDTIVINGILFLKQDAVLKFSKVTRDSI